MHHAMRIRYSQQRVTGGGPEIWRRVSPFGDVSRAVYIAWQMAYIFRALAAYIYACVFSEAEEKANFDMRQILLCLAPRRRMP